MSLDRGVVLSLGEILALASEMRWRADGIDDLYVEGAADDWSPRSRAVVIASDGYEDSPTHLVVDGVALRRVLMGDQVEHVLAELWQWETPDPQRAVDAVKWYCEYDGFIDSPHRPEPEPPPIRILVDYERGGEATGRVRVWNPNDFAIRNVRIEVSPDDCGLRLLTGAPLEVVAPSTYVNVVALGELDPAVSVEIVVIGDTPGGETIELSATLVAPD